MEIKKSLLKIFMAALFSSGLLLAGAETEPNSHWWPWVNLLGLFLFLLFVALAHRIRPGL